MTLVHFRERRRLLLPALAFVMMFFSVYYVTIMIPWFGFYSVEFLVDFAGGGFVCLGLVSSFFLSKRLEQEWVLCLPTLGGMVAALLFLCHERFYQTMGHLWVSAQMIDVIFTIFFVAPRWSVVVCLVNALLPQLAACFFPHLIRFDLYLVWSGSIGFSSVVSIYMSYSTLQQKTLLMQARDEALEARSHKSDFLNRMSHEMRTPLNGMLGMLAIFKEETKLNSKQLGLIRTAEQCGDMLLSVINDVLDLSKIESGKVEFENRDFDLRLCVESCKALVEKTGSQRGLTIRVVMAPEGEMWLKGDVAHLRQIIVNYLSNSIKFARSESEILLKVQTQLQGETHCKVVVTVTDQGIGLSAEQIPKLFQMFSQVNGSISRKFGGTGLGLAICSQLAHLMGGHVFVSSPGLNQGSTFGLSLVLENGAPSAVEDERTISAGPPTQILPPAGPILSSSSVTRILVAEDNVVNQQIVRHMFARLGHDISIAANGLEVLEAVRLNYPTIIFMDMMMPKMDGITATKKLVELHGDKLCPIIGLTACVFDEDEVRCRAAGMTGFLSKPVSMLAIKNVLLEHGISAEVQTKPKTKDQLRKKNH